MPSDKQPRVFFRNYNLYETEGVGGQDKTPSPGQGFYSQMHKFKSISDFLRQNASNKNNAKWRC